MKTISYSSILIAVLNLHWAESIRLGLMMSWARMAVSRIWVFLISFTTQRQFMFKMNLEPCPSWLFTSTDPPICSIIFLQIDRPSPVPWEFLFEFSLSFEKSINKCFKPFSDIPIPVSITLILSLRYLYWPSLRCTPESDLFLTLTFFLTKSSKSLYPSSLSIWSFLVNIF